MDDRKLSYSLSPSKRKAAHMYVPKRPGNPLAPPEGTTRFLLTVYKHKWLGSTLLVYCVSDVPIHLWLLWTEKPLGVHKGSVDIAGRLFMYDPLFCFVEYTGVEQNEPGDTYEHTFSFGGWHHCEERWWLIYGDINEVRSLSCTAVMYAHYMDYEHADPTVAVVESLGKYYDPTTLTDAVKLEAGEGISITLDVPTKSFIIKTTF